MSEPTTTMMLAGFALAGLAMMLLAGLSAWRGWLELRRMELGGGQAPAEAKAAAGGSMAELIELADLRERIRKLESIAACVDL